MKYKSEQGSNKITSALMNFLKRTKGRALRRRYKEFYLFSDSCASQNNNQIMLFALL